MDQGRGSGDEGGEQRLFTQADSVGLPLAMQPSAPESLASAGHDTHAVAGASHPAADSVSWTASEFTAHHKTGSWYLLFGLAGIAIAVVAWFTTRDLFATITVLIGVLLLGVYSTHKPRQQRYVLDGQGLAIGSRHYSFSDFRSFSLASEGAFSSIELMPLKRFAMFTAMYFDPADQQKIVGLLSAHLPMEAPRNDFTDGLMRRIKF